MSPQLLSHSEGINSTWERRCSPGPWRAEGRLSWGVEAHTLSPQVSAARRPQDTSQTTLLRRSCSPGERRTHAPLLDYPIIFPSCPHSLTIHPSKGRGSRRAPSSRDPSADTQATSSLPFSSQQSCLSKEKQSLALSRLQRRSRGPGLGTESEDSFPAPLRPQGRRCGGRDRQCPGASSDRAGVLGAVVRTMPESHQTLLPTPASLEVSCFPMPPNSPLTPPNSGRQDRWPVSPSLA